MTSEGEGGLDSSAGSLIDGAMIAAVLCCDAHCYYCNTLE